MGDNSRALTRIDLHYEQGRCNYRLVFGKPLSTSTNENAYGVRRESALFEPGSILALDLWEPTAAGRTRRWKTFVLQTGRPGEILTAVPQVSPGSHVLMEATGARRCKFLLQWLAELQSDGDPTSMSAEFFQGRDLWFQGMVPEQWRPSDLHRRG